MQADDVLAYVRARRAPATADAAVIEALRSTAIGSASAIAERARLCRLEPAPGGRLQVTFAASLEPATSPRSAARRRIAPGARTAPSRRSARRQARAGGGRCSSISATARAGAPTGRCCDVCDPDTIGLPDPASLTPARRQAGCTRTGCRPLDPADAGLLETLRQWRVRAATASRPTRWPTTARSRRSRAAPELARRAGGGQGGRAGVRGAPRRGRARDRRRQRVRVAGGGTISAGATAAARTTGSTLLSNRVIAQIRSPARVTTNRPVAVAEPSGPWT